MHIIIGIHTPASAVKSLNPNQHRLCHSISADDLDVTGLQVVYNHTILAKSYNLCQRKILMIRSRYRPI